MEAMKRWTVFAALAVLGVVLAAHGTVRAADDPLPPDKSGSSGKDYRRRSVAAGQERSPGRNVL